MTQREEETDGEGGVIMGDFQIKTLDWDGPHLKLWVSTPLPGLEYRIICDERGYMDYSWFVGGTWTPVDSLDEAKAAAQADYEQRIRSVILRKRTVVCIGEPTISQLRQGKEVSLTNGIVLIPASDLVATPKPEAERELYQKFSDAIDTIEAIGARAIADLKGGQS